jgi:hypothetical protein
MGKAKNGPYGPHSGKIGNSVYYTLNGQQVSRGIGLRTKPPTEAELTSRLATKVCSEFLSSVKEFITAGFSVEAQGTKWNPFNLAVMHNRSKIIKGTYPDLEIDYSKVILSAGKLKPAENWQVTETGAGLRYSWETHPKMPWPESSDQVMMLAYFPAKQKVVYTLFGNSRLSGSDVLEIQPSLQGEYMETYLSFVAADRKQLADSIYTGSFNSGTVQGLLPAPSPQLSFSF